MTRHSPPSDRDKSVDLYQSGMTQKEIGEHFGVRQATVSRWLLKRGAGITAREARLRYNARRTPEQRSAQSAAAHAAVRGMKRTVDDRTRRAAGVERVGKMNRPERALFDWLLAAGLCPTPQKAVGVYNLDFAVESVAVELFGGGWHAYGQHVARLEERTRYLFDQGWHLYIIWAHHAAHVLLPEVANDLVGFVEEMRGNPATRRQYRVVWGDGDRVSCGSSEDDHLALIPARVRSTHVRT
jgi:very-short-patch-repair endonuclease